MIPVLIMSLPQLRSSSSSEFCLGATCRKRLVGMLARLS